MIIINQKKIIVDIYYYLYTITWLLCAFSLVVDRDLLKGTHIDGVKSTSDHVSRLLFLFSFPPNTSINHLNFYCIKQIDYICPCVCTALISDRSVVYCNISQMTSQHEKNKKVLRHETKSSGMTVVLYTLLRHLWSIIIKITILQ